MTTAVLIVAAGSGSRLGASLPKQYLPLGGRAILAHTIAAFAGHPRIDAIQLVINPDHRPLYQAAVAPFSLPAAASGGASRQQSVARGLAALAASDDGPPERVLIHDAARPFVTADLIDRVIEALDDADGALPALPLADTLKRAAGGVVRETVPRDGLWRAQTPQGFHFAAIVAAHEKAAGQQLTDDVAVAEAAGMTVKLVPGAEENFKVTHAADLFRAENQLFAGLMDIRIGQGFDVHAFCPGDQVTLCGIGIPHDRALAGHSDADVGLHALTDAVLGALAEGDIGSHFPPSEAKWKGASSDRFLAHAAQLVAERHGVIAHLDLTIICERPRLRPHIDAMRAKIAALLAIDQGRISVKATTTEGLGFTGRGEGIAAEATATVRLPMDSGARHDE